ncbi:MAG: hypothetical protein GXP29_11740 [Planctomycetes bacterium]|nr:hypothetical protein [Planctomycetota bacterium]
MSTEFHPTSKQDPTPKWLASYGGYIFGVLFFALGAFFWLNSDPNMVPSASTPKFDKAELSIAPRRKAPSDPPTTVIAGFEQRCNACHKLFKSNWDGKRPLAQHLDIKMGHGINNDCRNCHARDDRERLVLHDGTTVPFAKTEQLCRQCHGPVFRDWERGAHGKTLGSWKPSSPDAHRLTCAECHDPHAPAYASMAPLPGPNTLRMGHPSAAEHADDNNPLQRWLRQAEKANEAGKTETSNSSDKSNHEEGGH